MKTRSTLPYFCLRLHCLTFLPFGSGSTRMALQAAFSKLYMPEVLIDIYHVKTSKNNNNNIIELGTESTLAHSTIATECQGQELMVCSMTCTPTEWKYGPA